MKLGNYFNKVLFFLRKLLIKILSSYVKLIIYICLYWIVYRYKINREEIIVIIIVYLFNLL